MMKMANKRTVLCSLGHTFKSTGVVREFKCSVCGRYAIIDNNHICIFDGAVLANDDLSCTEVQIRDIIE